MGVMNRIVRMLVLAGILLTWEPLGSLALGPLHLHDGETTPHRDHESEDQPVVVAVLVTPLSSVSPLKALVLDAAIAPVALDWVAIESPLSRRILALGARSPPPGVFDADFPLLI